MQRVQNEIDRSAEILPEAALVEYREALKTYEAAGIPWKNMIAYIGSENKPENKKMYELLHARQVVCMISAAPVYDKLPPGNERAAAYRNIFEEGADILESDYPVEVAAAIGIEQLLQGSRKKYLKGN